MVLAKPAAQPARPGAAPRPAHLPAGKPASALDAAFGWMAAAGRHADFNRKI